MRLHLNSTHRILALSFFLCVSGSALADSPTMAGRHEIVDVGRFTVPGTGSVNTYWIETLNSVVVIDLQRDIESANSAIEKIRLIDKPVRALLLTHPHPDHIGGIYQFKKSFPEAILYASEATADEIRNDSLGYQKLSRDVLKGAAPSSYPVPDKILEDADRIEVDGIVIESREFGLGESVSANVYYVATEGALFSGDIIGNGVTDFFLEGRTGPWLLQVESLRDSYPKAKKLYPGHGAPGNPSDLIEHQEDYMTFFRSQVALQVEAKQWSGEQMSDIGLSAIKEAVEANYPGYLPVAAIPNLLDLNVNAVAKEIGSSQSEGK